MPIILADRTSDYTDGYEDIANGRDKLEEESSPLLKESLETTLEIIAEDPVLRVLLKQIPLVGDSLTELAAGKGQQIIEARRDEFLRLLAKHLSIIEEQAARKDFFKPQKGSTC